MSFDKETRNLLAKTVTACRRRLTEDVIDQLRGVFGLHPDGTVLALEEMTHLSPDQTAAARRLRDLLDHYTAGAAGGEKDRRKAAYERMTLEISFTILNRLAALRLCEERGLVIECVRKGTASDGFRLFERISGGALGGRYDTYRVFLECLFDELALDLGVLFDRMAPQSAVFPSERCMEDVLAELNKPELSHLWTEDETIGWVYQYFNPPEERRAMRDASQAPRNSRELAVRNQFFTPRYVVEFLTDNTLGRIWYEMRKGDTALKDECRYLVRRPNEIFLASGEKAPPSEENESDLPREELKKPVYIEHRPKKDPRDLRVLDPACGSGHFLLYAFDLLERIYEEAWEDPESPKSEITGQSLREEFETIEELRRAVPKLIIEHSLHGVDIDPRAVQIAALALWLRAQKTWKNLGLKAAERPQVTKSNIVTAEPMPGEKDMKEEFTAGLKPRVLGQLVDVVFDKMKLAGEAGSLLKIEEEIKDAVAEAKKQWLEGPKPEQTVLFPELAEPKPEQQQFRFDLTGVTEERFWEQAEDRILAALKDYAERAENGRAVRRRLFAEDAARGFSFIDLCRKRYDVVLMNPPFGEPSEITKEYFQSRYASLSGNILCAFIEGQITHMHEHGMTGSVIDRTIFIKNSYEDFRRNILLELQRMKAVADLGWGVLDANVEVSCLIFSRRSRGSLMFGANIASSEDKEADLCHYCSSSELIPISTFLNMPFAAINFDVPKFFFRILTQSQPISVSHGTFYNGHTIKSDVFKRLFWEVNAVGHNKIWKRMWNGSEYFPFYVSMQEVVITKGYAGGLENHPTTIIRNPDKHFRSGLCFGKRGDYLDVQILPKGFVLTNEGFGGPFEDNQKTWLILAYINSRLAQYMVNLYCGQHKGVGYVGKLPVFNMDEKQAERISALCKYLYKVARHTNQLEETDPLFRCLSLRVEDTGKPPFVLDGKLQDIYKKFNESINELDQIIYNQADLSEDEKLLVEQETCRRPLHRILINYSANDGGTFSSTALLSYLLGLVFGRWDVRIAMDPSLAPKLPDPFDPLPVCPPGMLVGPDGLPASPGRIVSEEWLRARPDANTLPAAGAVKNPTIPDPDYPLRISWDGVLVDDPGFNGGQPHRDDIVRRVREVLDLLWKDKAYEIEQEACEILGVSDLRDYFRKPAKFFQDHLKRYSKSRRKAPIYWPISTASGSYTLWLYYHRLTDQTLYAAVNKYVEPKIVEVERGLNRIEDDLKAASGRDATRLRDRLSEAQSFLGELRDLREELLRIAALPYKPNLNDGVIINAAPLHNLFRLRTWANDTKKVWSKLKKGGCDWAHLAYTIWPERVREVCKKDRSIAIAHGLEDICEVEAPAPKKKGGRGRRRKVKS